MFLKSVDAGRAPVATCRGTNRALRGSKQSFVETHWAANFSAPQRHDQRVFFQSFRWNSVCCLRFGTFCLESDFHEANLAFEQLSGRNKRLKLVDEAHDPTERELKRTEAS